MSEISDALRSALLLELWAIPAGEPVAVFLSSGTDSMSVLFALLELGREVRTYTFALEGVDSTDLRMARRTAAVFELPHTIVRLPMNEGVLVRDVVLLIRSLGIKKKTAVECTWPMWRTFPRVVERHVVTGHCADTYFGLSKRAMIHLDKHDPAALESYARALLNDPDYAQTRTLRRLLAVRGRTLWVPYRSPHVGAALLGHSWNELNRPRKKQPIRDTFPGRFARCPAPHHIQFQCGDSGIAAHFSRVLLASRLNVCGYKSVTGVYNAVAKGNAR